MVQEEFEARRIDDYDAGNEVIQALQTALGVMTEATSTRGATWLAMEENSNAIFEALSPDITLALSGATVENPVDTSNPVFEVEAPVIEAEVTEEVSDETLDEDVASE